MSEKPGRLGVGVIGPGRVGTVLASALAQAGHALTAISSASDDRIDRALALLPGVAVVDVEEVVRRSELVLVTVPRDDLAQLVAGLAELGVWQPGQLVIHTAAEFGTEVLAPAASLGAIPIALHPAMSFTGTSLDLSRLRDSYVAVTCATALLPIGQALVVEMGAEPLIIDEGDRAAYADAVQAASEFSAAVVRQASAQLSELGVEHPGRVLGALIRSSVDDALRRHEDGSDELAH